MFTPFETVRRPCAVADRCVVLKLRRVFDKLSELKSSDPRACPECGGSSLYQTTTSSAGAYGPTLLPGLGGFLSFAKFRIVVCADCGLTRFYAEPSARGKLKGARHWSRV